MKYYQEATTINFDEEISKLRKENAELKARLEELENFKPEQLSEL